MNDNQKIFSGMGKLKTCDFNMDIPKKLLEDTL